MSDLPEHARERLADQREHQLFTSDLSVSEFLLVREAGFEPVGLVMGTSIHRIELADNGPRRRGLACEVTEVTRALNRARELAMARMEEEAEALEADGIIGVRLTVNLNTDPGRLQWQRYRIWVRWADRLGFRRPEGAPLTGWWAEWPDAAAWQWKKWCAQMGWAQVPLSPWDQPAGPTRYSLGPNTAEFLAIGTAVRHRGGARLRNRHGKPFQSDLSGQDFWLLLQAGYQPVGFVMGNAVYYIPPRLLPDRDRQSRELLGYTKALSDARGQAMRRLEREAEELGATGVVGVTVADSQHTFRAQPWEVGNAALSRGELIELFVIGTAVVEAAGGDPGRPTLVLAASDKVAAEGRE